MKEISEQQAKRAVNLIWTSARDYQFTPDFKAYDEEGNADLYWNCIIGAVHRHYDYSQFRPLFASFSEYEDGDIYTGLLWLGLENCTYGREVRDRPVLKNLRLTYAGNYIARYGTNYLDDSHLYDCLALAHYMRILGIAPKMSSYDLHLLDELEFTPEMSTEEIAAKAKDLFSQWLSIRAEERKRDRKTFSFSLRRKRKREGRIRRYGLVLLEQTGLSSGGGSRNQGPEELHSQRSQEELRTFMAGKFGASLYPGYQIREIERQLCRDSHEFCHLHFTKGEHVDTHIQNGFEALQREKERVQIAKNRKTYQANLVQNQMVIARLAAKIQNSVLMHLQPVQVKSNTGALDGKRVWRALYLRDDQVFLRNEQGNMGDLCVDILLDSSTSQKNRQEIVSTQGYMIAEALTRCNIPCRVMSFCSMTGYTILRVFRDYQETSENQRIFDYVSNGCNRDGLAIRAAHHLIRESPYEHKLLIVLSDVRPNDNIRTREGRGGGRLPYDGEVGIRDTALEVRRAMADGIAVICVYTGNDEDLPGVKTVYGHNFARIQSLNMLADTVGILIQNQIRNL